MAYWLTGQSRTERTNASTTGLLDVRTGEWDVSLIGRLGLPPDLFGELVDPGTPVGPLLATVRADLGSPPVSASWRSARTTPPPPWSPCR